MEGWWYEGAASIATPGSSSAPGPRRNRRRVREPGSRAKRHVDDPTRGHARQQRRQRRSKSRSKLFSIPPGKSRRGKAPRQPSIPLEESVRGTIHPGRVAAALVRSTIRISTKSEPSLRGGEHVIMDAVTTPAGSARFVSTPTEGFFLNDQPLKLKGVCNHQDHAGVGVAVPDSLWDFRIRRLKEMGANAYRCSHHPPAAEFLDACDRLGMLVMDENRNFNTTPEYMRHLEWLVRRDRNHPSVILWSVFNEEPLQGTAQGYEMVRRIVLTRCEAARCHPPGHRRPEQLDAQPGQCSRRRRRRGLQLSAGRIRQFRAANPTSRFVSSEDTSQVMTRGEYETDCPNSSWLPTTPSLTPGPSHHPATPGSKSPSVRSWPAPLSGPASIITANLSRSNGPPPLVVRLPGSVRISQSRLLHPPGTMDPRQTHPAAHPALELGRPRRPVRQGHGPDQRRHVALFLNGKPLEEKPVDRYEMVSWDVPYEPGKLEAVAKKGGQDVARFAVETTGPPVRCNWSPTAQLSPATAGTPCR